VFCCDELEICGDEQEIYCDELEICCDELDLRDNGYSLPTRVSLLTLTLTRGPVSLVTMVSEPALPLLAVGSGRVGNVIFFILANDANAWACQYFFE
jgi:hypothetical protein